MTISLSEFESLFRSYYQALCGYANSYLDDQAAAEETVQSLFVKLWESRDSLTIENSVKAYLYRATRNACFNQLRHLKVRDAYKSHNEMERSSSTFDAADQLVGEELSEKIEISIQQLPEGRRKIFMLSRYEGLKYKEIADQLNISIKTVENQMGSALKQLKLDLAEYLIVIAIIVLNNLKY